jgi:hypothetical protein
LLDGTDSPRVRGFPASGERSVRQICRCSRFSPSVSGAILGRELSPSALDDIHRAIREARDPGRYAVHQLDVDGRPVIVIGVARRIEGFAQTSSGRILVRRGTMKVAHR